MLLLADGALGCRRVGGGWRVALLRRGHPRCPSPGWCRGRSRGIPASPCTESRRAWRSRSPPLRSLWCRPGRTTPGRCRGTRRDHARCRRKQRGRWLDARIDTERTPRRLWGTPVGAARSPPGEGAQAGGAYVKRCSGVGKKIRWSARHDSLFRWPSRCEPICELRRMTSIIAHRGASAAEPENTLAAFRRAAALGSPTGSSSTCAAPPTASWSSTTIRGCPTVAPCDSCAPRRADLPPDVPTLDAALDACAGMFVNIEIKNDPSEPDFDRSEWVAHRVCTSSPARRQEQRWLISSFRSRDRRLCRLVAPAVCARRG